MRLSREARAERVEVSALVCEGKSGVVYPGLSFEFYNYLNDRLAAAEFCCSPAMLLDFVAAVQRTADIATSEAMAANDELQADAN